MIFTSYAQNFEDVVLWRALKHIPHGRYIDIGAQHPVVDSVSKGFYEQGWRGIHVEPVPHYAELLRQDRPDETVLAIAISEQSGVIDVEGFEEHVLRSWDSRTLRPWIVVVEATAPMSQTSTHAAWEPLILKAGHRFVYFDGLNRFYVADEQAQLVSAFCTPPNVFDDARLGGTSGVRCDTRTGRLIAAEEGLRAQAAQTAALQAQLEQAEQAWAKLEQQRVQHEATLREQAEQVQTRLEQQHVQHEVTLRQQLDWTRARHLVAQAQWVIQLQAIQLRAQEERLRAEEADNLAAHARQEATQAHARALEQEQTARQSLAREQALLASTSWRLSAPIRWLGAPFARLRSALREGRIKSGLRRRVKNGLRRIARVLVRHPALGRMARQCLGLIPGLRARLSAALAPPPVAAALPPPMSADARQILLRLRTHGERSGDSV